jgi:hypothetical protein
MSELPTGPAPSAAPAPPRVPALVRAYGAAGRRWSRAGALLQAVHEGTWLGLLGRADLHLVDERYYDTSAVYHDDAHNARGLFPWETDALAFFPGRGRLLVMAAGGGREVLALSRMGYEVEGYECNRALAASADDFLPRQGCPALVRYLPRDEVPAAGEPFDGIILGWSAYTLMAGRAHRIDLLRRLLPLVKPGGPILISFFTRNRAYAPRFRISAAVANGIRTVLRRERAEVGDALSPNFVHYFVPQEIEAEFREAGWEPRRFTPAGPGIRDSGWAVGVAPGAPAPPPV